MIGPDMLFLLLSAISLANPDQQDEFFSDGTNFVYYEQQSCALYVDMPDGAMIRLSYRHYSRTTFFSVVGGPWDAVTVGDHYMTSLSSNLAPNQRQSFVSTGIIQPGSDNRRGVAADRGEELLPLFRQAASITINTEDRLRATYTLRNMSVAMDKLVSCSLAHFSAPPT